MSERETSLEVEQHLRQMNDEWVKAMMRGDGPTLERIMADDFVFSYPLEGDDKDLFIAAVISGDLRIEHQFIADLSSGDLRIEHLTRGHSNVRIFGSTAII